MVITVINNPQLDKQDNELIWVWEIIQMSREWVLESFDFPFLSFRVPSTMERCASLILRTLQIPSKEESPTSCLWWKRLTFVRMTTSQLLMCLSPVSLIVTLQQLFTTLKRWVSHSYRYFWIFFFFVSLLVLNLFINIQLFAAKPFSFFCYWVYISWFWKVVTACSNGHWKICSIDTLWIMPNIFPLPNRAWLLTWICCWGTAIWCPSIPPLLCLQRI